MTTPAPLNSPLSSGRSFKSALLSFARNTLPKLILAYVLLLVLHAFLGKWTPDYLKGRDLWHFMISRMVVPMVMLGVFASFIRLVPASLLLTSILLGVGTLSSIKRESTGEPFQVSDLFLVGQSGNLLGYVQWYKWLPVLVVIAALVYALRSLRFRAWSIPLFATCVALLCTYRIEAVAQWIHDNSWRIGVENLTFSQAESERMNGLGTHLYFSTAGLRLKTYDSKAVSDAMEALDVDPVATPAPSPLPDVYIVLGEAWWRDPWDTNSAFDKLKAAGFSEGQAVSPVYGGTTPNAEFEVLTGVPIKSFQAGIIPFQHYVSYFSAASRALPRMLSELGYQPRAYHNFTPRFWLRDQNYPKFGFTRFDSMENMTLAMQDNGWPTDDGLFDDVLSQTPEAAPQFNYIVTVSTHGPFKSLPGDKVDGKDWQGTTDYRKRLNGAVDALIKFDAAIKARGRPYVLLAFGDHLPGLRFYQWQKGIKSEQDERLHLASFAVSSSYGNAQELRDLLEGRPFTCFSPTLTQWLKLGVKDRYFLHVAKACNAGKDGAPVPSEPVVQNQLFSDSPQP